MKLNLNRMHFDIIDGLKNIGQFVNEGPGHWIYPLGVIVELNSALFSQHQLPDVRNYLSEELQKNYWAFTLSIVPEHPLRDEAAVVLTSRLQNAEPFRVRRQSFTELFTNELRRQGFIRGDRMVRRAHVRFHRAICEETRGRAVNSSFFRSVLENYSQDHDFFKIEESFTPVDRGYTLSELKEATAKDSDGPGFIEVKPHRIRNSTRGVAYVEVPSLAFSSVKGIALLPGQTLTVLQRLDVESIKQQFESSSRQTDEDLSCQMTLPESEFDLLPRQSIVFKPLSLPFRPQPTTRLFPGELERHQLLYIGARVRSLRTEVYIPDFFDPTLSPPMSIAVGHTHADRARWYAFSQPCELQVSESTRLFRILPGYLVKADGDHIRIRNMHSGFKPPQTDQNIAAISRYEIMVEPSGDETLITVRKPNPLVVAAFSEYDVQDIRFGQDRFQLRISRPYRRRASATSEGAIREETMQGLTQARAAEDRGTVLNLRDGPALNSKPWRKIAFDETFVVGNQVFKVTKN